MSAPRNNHVAQPIGDRHIAACILLAAACATALLFLAGCEALQPRKERDARQAWDQQRASLKHELASAELKRGHPQEAVTLAQEAVVLSPQDAAHAELLAKAYLASGDFSSARGAAEVGKQLNPDAASLSYLLGTIAEREQRWDRAISEYRAAAEAAPESLEYWGALAQALAQSGDIASGIAILSDQTERFNGEAAFFVTLAELYRHDSRLEPACDAYRRAMQLGDNNPKTREAFGLCLAWIGRHREALDYLEPLLRSRTDVGDAVLTAYATCLLATNQHDAAAEFLKAKTDDRVDNGQLWLLLAQARADSDPAAAKAAAQNAARLMPQSAEAFTVLAGLCLANKQLDEAARAAERALSLEPQSVDALLLYGRLCELRGDRAAARSALRAAQQVEPGNELVAKSLTRLGE